MDFLVARIVRIFKIVQIYISLKRERNLPANKNYETGPFEEKKKKIGKPVKPPFNPPPPPRLPLHIRKITVVHRPTA